ncbi:ATPase family AAA domain-containing protein At1g05910-like [Lolium rigidum]|uniref:ATPase family AAA domain-containing protein At1g05910-like n=1 Tax=Lolium rigidum TaxID=89674 RepID=UPI001F5C7576|nr:ATPase family AAA domain-containing protein At1g05910-like [Lolium rigidum]
MAGMDGKGDGPVAPVRSSDRLRQRPKYYGRGFLYYSPNMRNKMNNKKRAAASQIAKKMLRKPAARDPPADSVAANLRRSTRKRRVSVTLDGYGTDSSSMEDDDLMRPRYRSSKSKVNDQASERPKRKNMSNSNSMPRREGLRPRRSLRGQRHLPFQDSDDDQESSEEHTQDQRENGNDIEEDDANEEEVDGGDEAEEDGDDEDGEEEPEGRKKYDLRDRAEVRRPSPRKEVKHRPQSPRRVLVHGAGPKNSKYLKKSGSRMHKRPRFSMPDDSDDSLLVDEPDEGPSMPWMRSGRGGMPWLLGGMDMHDCEQLRAVLMTLLNELASNLPVLLLGTSSVAFDDLRRDPEADKSNYLEQDSSKQFLKAYKVVPEMIKAATEFVYILISSAWTWEYHLCIDEDKDAQARTERENKKWKNEKRVSGPRPLRRRRLDWGQKLLNLGSAHASPPAASPRTSSAALAAAAACCSQRGTLMLDGASETSDRERSIRPIGIERSGWMGMLDNYLLQSAAWVSCRKQKLSLLDWILNGGYPFPWRALLRPGAS